MRGSSYLCAVSVGFLTTLAMAGTTLEMESVAASAATSQRLEISDGRLRLSTGGDDQVLLFTEGSDRLKVLDEQRRTAMTISPDQMRDAMQQSRDMMEQMRETMAQQLSQMPPEARAQAEQMMRNMGAGGDRRAPGKASVTVTRRSERVGTWQCRIAQLRIEDGPTSEMCFVDPQALGMDEGDFRTLKAFFATMNRFGRAAGEGMGVSPELMPEAMPGVPVRVYEISGTMRTPVMELKRVEKGAIPAVRFEVPAGYREEAYPGMRPSVDR